MASSFLNLSIFYSLFVTPILTPLVTTVVCNPLFMIPSLVSNYLLLDHYYIYFYKSAYITNIFLKPNGKQAIYETLDGESHLVNNKDIYKRELVRTRFAKRIEIYYGANKFMYLRGNAYCWDSHILDAIIHNQFIDVKNVQYDFNLTKEFTWDFKELAEIKKLKRHV